MQVLKITKKRVTIILYTVLILIWIIYFGARQYQKYQIEKSKEQSVANAQADSLKEALAEIEKLRQENEQTRENQAILEQKVSRTVKTTTKDLTISSAELAPFLSGVVEISCKDREGSGSLWNIPGPGYIVLTNKHVIGKPLGSMEYCFISIENGGLYALNPSQPIIGMVKSELDIATHHINFLGAKDSSGNEIQMTPVKDLNYRISSLKRCSVKMPLGSPVVLIGFPAFSETTSFLPGVGTARQTSQTITNGIISAHDRSDTEPLGPLLYVNYFVSAKIDSGNSGGIALAKDNDGLCILGIPTWLTVGNYETQGLVQNIQNIFTD